MVSRTVLFAIPILFIALGYKLNSLLEPPPLPKLDENAWWGPGSPEEDDLEPILRPFNISVNERVLEYLTWRLESHRPLTPPLQGVQQQYGMNTDLLKDVIIYWQRNYNWTARQIFLNQYPQYHTKVQGLAIHVVHVNPIVQPGIKIVPLLLLHGWPGSVREFFELIPKLTTPQKGRNYMFEVIIPHLPGFGFSQGAVRPGLGAAQVAVLFKNLMNKLGFERFYVQGGDFGAIILRHMAVLYPDTVLGYHSNMCVVSTPKSILRTLLGAVIPSWYVKPEHYNRIYPLSEHIAEAVRESGYLHLQATKPDTLGVAINDSPIGLAAYILEKFVTGTNITFQLLEDGGLFETYPYRNLIDNIMIYYISASATTSFRLYAETFSSEHNNLGIMRHPLQVPSACARFSNDIYVADGVLGEIFPNLVQLTDYEGGHFAAFQLPDVLANDIFDAIEKFEEFNKRNRPKLLEDDRKKRFPKNV